MGYPQKRAPGGWVTVAKNTTDAENTPYRCKKHGQPSQKTCPPTRTVAKNTRHPCKKHLPREPSQKTRKLATVAKNMSYLRKKHATPNYYNAESYEDQSHLFDESQFYEPEPQLKALKRQLFVLSIKSLLVFLSHQSVSATQASQRPKPHTRASQPRGTLTSLSIEYPVHCSSLARCLVFLLCQILRVVAPPYIGCTPSSA